MVDEVMKFITEADPEVEKPLKQRQPVREETWS